MLLLARQELFFHIDEKEDLCRAIQSALVSSNGYGHFTGLEPRLDQVNEQNVTPRIWHILSRFLEFHVHASCKESRSLSLSLEYSRNMGLTWQLFRYLTLNLNQSSIVHEDLLDDMNHDGIQIRFVFPTAIPKCWKLEQVTKPEKDSRMTPAMPSFDRLLSVVPVCLLR